MPALKRLVRRSSMLRSLGARSAAMTIFLLLRMNSSMKLEKIVHARALADDVLDVVDDEHVHAVIRLHDRCVAFLLAIELRHQVVEVCLRVGVLHLDLGRLFGELVFDGKQQVRLAQARFAVDEQRCARAAFVREGGKLECRAIGMAVLGAVDKVLKGKF